MTIRRRDNLESAASLSAWVRGNENLDSRCGFAATDFDVVWHQYATRSDGGISRLKQNMMVIETKTYNAKLTYAQADTLRIFKVICGVARGGRQPRIYKIRNCKGQTASCRWWGHHLLVFSGEGPEDSESIRWDTIPITKSILEEILMFKRSPLTLRPRDERNHHALGLQSIFRFNND